MATNKRIRFFVVWYRKPGRGWECESPTRDREEMKYQVRQASTLGMEVHISNVWASPPETDDAN